MLSDCGQPRPGQGEFTPVLSGIGSIYIYIKHQFRASFPGLTERWAGVDSSAPLGGTRGLGMRIKSGVISRSRSSQCYCATAL
ncbi:hypothetical protein PoB_007478200 [Plakobranchus ocellatus]|uniref:Uncharacterized protein n=1 Tax=Plakobranchus ocellatus TaxID=259542 RepID=A0AAV4DW89_9GAST|nr:hypothetical protein PoB_007478200 [Plakobranchus ocellatus]